MVYLDKFFLALVMVGFVYFALAAFANAAVRQTTTASIMAKDRYIYIVTGAIFSIGAVLLGYFLFRDFSF